MFSLHSKGMWQQILVVFKSPILTNTLLKKTLKPRCIILNFKIYMYTVFVK